MEKKVLYVLATVSLFLMDIQWVLADKRGKIKGIEEITNELDSNRNSFEKLWESFVLYAYIVAAFIAVVGGVQIYGKIQKGDNQAAEKMGWWVGGLVFIFFAIGLVGTLFFSKN